MNLDFQTYSAIAFIRKPKTVMLGKWQVNYLAFGKPETLHKTPAVFIGGAFQTFFSFKKEVQCMWEDAPIILIDLPSQGTNTQLCPELEFEDFAKILKHFVDHFNIPKIIPIGLSYGSAPAFYFASLYPDLVEKLILGGTTPTVRDAYRILLEDSIDLLTNGEMETFSEGAVTNLINYSKRHITKIPDRVIKGFYKNMMNLDDNCKQRYKDNTNRLLHLKEVLGEVKCPTLVFTGEYDNFTTPYENFLISKKIPGSEFLLIKNGDHLANLEHRDLVIDVYRTFMQEKSLKELEGIEYLTGTYMEERDRRLEPRYIPKVQTAHIIDGKEHKMTCRVVDISNHGCQLEIDPLELEKLDSRHYVHIKLDDNPELDLIAYFLTKDRLARCIFRRSEFSQSDHLSDYISSLVS